MGGKDLLLKTEQSPIRELATPVGTYTQSVSAVDGVRSRHIKQQYTYLINKKIVFYF